MLNLKTGSKISSEKLPVRLNIQLPRIDFYFHQIIDIPSHSSP